ncbi:DNA-directed RNA polymerase III subunit RPC3-like [Ptychodera flava]|uniref:DNA-directed RNA polymerase III subunit RPC3-like n=1 Tax=Ptychodera flava TaxID=63121 RepID=UPI003969E1DC
MSGVQIRLAALLLRDHYGEIVEKVGTYLIKHGARPLRLIAQENAVKLDQVRKALCVLIQHNIVKFAVNKRGFVEYQADVKKVLLHTRYPKYIYCAKTLYGDAGEIIVEELLQNGQMLMSAAVRRVTERLNEAIEDNQKIEESYVRGKFIDLINTHFLQRVASPPADTGSSQPPVPNLVINEQDLYKIPVCMTVGGSSLQTQKRKRSVDEGSDNPRKRQRTDSTMSEDLEAAPDDGIYWSVNYDRFHQHIRDQIIIESVAVRVDKIAAEVVRTMLRMSEVTTDPKATLTTPISSHEIFHALPKELKLPRQTFDQYLKLLNDDRSEFISKNSESGGGMYVINIYKAIKTQCTAHVESVIQERFGSKCYRIFRLLLLKKHLEQKQVEEFAMIPAKEAKELLYRMFSDHIVALQEIPRTPDHAPSRTIYLFSVNLNEVSRMLLERCYKAQTNMIARREHDNDENKRLLEKSLKVEAISASLQNSGANADQAAEVEEMITPAERVQLNKLKNTFKKLEQTELQLDETVFILNSFVDMVV